MEITPSQCQDATFYTNGDGYPANRINPPFYTSVNQLTAYGIYCASCRKGRKACRKHPNLLCASHMHGGNPARKSAPILRAVSRLRQKQRGWSLNGSMPAFAASPICNSQAYNYRHCLCGLTGDFPHTHAPTTNPGNSRNCVSMRHKRGYLFRRNTARNRALLKDNCIVCSCCPICGTALYAVARLS